MNTPHPLTFRVSVRLDNMAKRRPGNPFRRKKNEPAPNRRYGHTNKRPDNAGTMNVPAALSTIQPPPRPVLPPARLIVGNVDARDNCCRSLKRNAPEADSDGFDFGNFEFDNDEDEEEFEWCDDAAIVGSDRPKKRSSYDESIQHHDLLSSNAAPAVSDSDLDSATAAVTIATTHVAPATSNSYVEERAIKIMEQKKNKKFRGKSDKEMAKTRKLNILSKGHTKTKENTIDRMFAYLEQDDDLNDLADWIVMPNKFIPRQRRLIVLTTGPKEPAKHEIWNEVLICVAIHLRMDDKARRIYGCKCSEAQAFTHRVRL